MGHTCKLELEDASGARTPVDITFEDDEWELLLRAGEYATALKQRELMDQCTLSTKLTIRWEQGKGLSAAGTIPSDEDVIVVLHRLRPLILQGEPTYFNRIVNLIARRANHQGMRRRLDALKRLFAGEEYQGLITLKVDGAIVNSEEMLNTYLNAFEFHRDAGKQLEFAKLHEILPSQATRAIFIHLIVEKLKAVRGLELFINLLQGKQEAMRL
jgi:hypothetical protein